MIAAGTTPVLAVRGLDAHHGHFQALHSIDLVVDEGETLAVIGANGAGKTTLLAALVGQVTSAGSVEFAGEPLIGLRPHERARRGITMVPEGRRLFPTLSVQENLIVGTASRRRGSWDLDAVYEVFPNLPGLRGRPAGALSGGEAQAVAIGRGLMANPRLLLLDEISLGLAPVVVERLYGSLVAIGRDGPAMIVVEQDVGQALRLAGRVHCLRAGRTVLTAAASDVTTAAVTEAYFGGAA